MAILSLRSVAALCTALLAVSPVAATPAAASSSKPPPASSSNPPPTTTSISQPGCPSKISLQNGGFESGKLAPWVDGDAGSSAPNSIVSPGFAGSKHAVQLTIPGGGQYSLSQVTTGPVCFGYYYNISYAWEWVNYTGPANACSFQVYTGYTDDNVPTHFATKKTGWHQNSYVARDLYSHCRPLQTDFLMFLTCDAGETPSPIEPFSVRFDAFAIKNAPGSPNPPPPPVNC